MHSLAMTTCPDREHAGRLAGLILDKRLAACVSIVPGVTSRYWWKGELQEGTELLLIIKTTAAMLKELEKTVKENHPYELPEFLVLDAKGSKEYLGWLSAETKS